jgi:hypothetical protein
VLDDPTYVSDGPGYVSNGPSYVSNGPSYVSNGPRYVVDGPSYVVDGPGYVMDGPGYVVDGPSYVPDRRIWRFSDGGRVRAHSVGENRGLARVEIKWGRASADLRGGPRDTHLATRGRPADVRPRWSTSPRKPRAPDGGSRRADSVIAT